jgi:hypothetical protein
VGATLVLVVAKEASHCSAALPRGNGLVTRAAGVPGKRLRIPSTAFTLQKPAGTLVVELRGGGFAG